MSDIATPPRAPYDWSGADWSRVPEHLHAGLRRYVEDGVPTGGGLRMILENARVCDAIGHLDPTTIGALREIVHFLRFNIPARAWGSAQLVATWIAHGGARGENRG